MIQLTDFEEQCKIIFSDFRDICLDKEANLIFADPPFGIKFKGNLQSYHRTPDSFSYNEVSKKDYSSFIQDLIDWSYRALKVYGSMWLISGWNNLGTVLGIIESSKFHILNHCIWRYQFGVFTKRRFTTAHYHLLLLVKNKNNYIFNKPEHYAEDVWFIKRPYQRGVKTAGNELPDQLVKKCILTSSTEGDLVVDPVLGSGTTMRICLQTGRKCIGIEINPALSTRIAEKLGHNRL